MSKTWYLHELWCHVANNPLDVSSSSKQSLTKLSLKSTGSRGVKGVRFKPRLPQKIKAKIKSCSGFHSHVILRQSHIVSSPRRLTVCYWTWLTYQTRFHQSWRASGISHIPSRYQQILFSCLEKKNDGMRKVMFVFIEIYVCSLFFSVNYFAIFSFARTNINLRRQLSHLFKQDQLIIVYHNLINVLVSLTR